MLIVPDMTQTDESIPLAGFEAPTTVIEPPDRKRRMKVRPKPP